MMKTTEDLLKQLVEISRQYREGSDEQQTVLNLISDIEGGKQDPTKIKINATMTLKKYDGEKTEGKEPVETITTTEEL